MYVSVNLLGLFVRGLFSNPELDKLKSDGPEFIKTEVKNYHRASKRANIVALILIIAYLYLLFYFWSLGVVLVAILFMAGRLPDLLWEIKHGKKINMESVKEMPRNATFYITVLLDFVAIPVLWYFL
jgi:hypothetical protein